MDGNFNSNIVYYFNDSTILKFLRNVLAEINPDYVDLGIRSAYLLKCYVEKYNIFEDKTQGPRLALLCMLKDIGTYYKSGEIKRRDHALAAASSYSFMKNCSPFGEQAKPLLYYMSKYVPGCDDLAERSGLLMSLVNQIIEYNYQEYTLEQIEDLIKKDTRGIFHPEQVKNIFRMLYDDPSIFENLNDNNSLFIYTTSKYISSANYHVSDLLRFIDMATFTFEFQDSETLAHTVTVAAIAEELARRSRLPDSMIAEIKLAALVHDIGKIRVPLEILTFPGKLNDEQFKEMKRHVIYTRDIITGCFSYQIVNIAAHHHEKLDGSGYPDGLKENDLSIGDKIISVADICSALYCRRSYKASFDDDKIKSILKEDMNNGKLDKRICEHLFRDWDDIMAIMKEVEKVVLDDYYTMKKEYDALIKSEALYKIFDYVDDVPSIFDSEEDYSEPEAEEEIIEEEIVEESEDNQEIVYVDENGNEIDPSEIDESLIVEEEIVEEQPEEVIEESEEIVDEEESEIELPKPEGVVFKGFDKNIEEQEEKLEENNYPKPEHVVFVSEKNDPEKEKEFSEKQEKAISEFADALDKKNVESKEDFEAHINSITEDLENHAKAQEEAEFDAYMASLDEKVVEAPVEEKIEVIKIEENDQLDSIASALKENEISEAKKEIFGEDSEGLSIEITETLEEQESEEQIEKIEDNVNFVEDEVSNSNELIEEEQESENDNELEESIESLDLSENDDDSDDEDEEDSEEDDDESDDEDEEDPDEDDDDSDDEDDENSDEDDNDSSDNGNNEVSSEKESNGDEEIQEESKPLEDSKENDAEEKDSEADEWEEFLKEVAKEEERLKKEGF